MSSPFFQTLEKKPTQFLLNGMKLYKDEKRIEMLV